MFEKTIKHKNLYSFRIPQLCYSGDLYISINPFSSDTLVLTNYDTYIKIFDRIDPSDKFSRLLQYYGDISEFSKLSIILEDTKSDNIITKTFNKSLVNDSNFKDLTIESKTIIIDHESNKVDNILIVTFSIKHLYYLEELSELLGGSYTIYDSTLKPLPTKIKF